MINSGNLASNESWSFTDKPTDIVFNYRYVGIDLTPTNKVKLLLAKANQYYFTTE